MTVQAMRLAEWGVMLCNAFAVLLHTICMFLQHLHMKLPVAPLLSSLAALYVIAKRVRVVVRRARRLLACQSIFASDVLYTVAWVAGLE